MRLTREQGAIVSAYTGITAGPFEDMHAYAERKLGRPVWTHEFASEALMAELREAAKEDFLALCAVRADDSVQASPSPAVPSP